MVIILKKRKNKLDKKERIIRAYNSTSPIYDQRYSTIQFDKYGYILRNCLLNGKILLDAGCGTGLLYEFIVNSMNQGLINNLTYVGIDISRNMLKDFE